jgi:hypothetical protein
VVGPTDTGEGQESDGRPYQEKSLSQGVPPLSKVYGSISQVRGAARFASERAISPGAAEGERRKPPPGGERAPGPVTIAVMRFVAMLATLGMAVEAMAVPAPMTIVSDEEADPLRSAIARKEAWTTEAVRHLRADADRRMLQGPWSVTADRPAGVVLDPHDYYSEASYYWPNPEDPTGPYIVREGRLNPERFSANRNALTQMCDTVFALGTAAYLFDDSRYALRAARVIQTWFINPRTRMNPNLEYASAIRGLNMGRPDGLLEGRVFIRAIQGMEFLSRTGNWDTKDQEAVRRWFQEYLQ